VNNESGAKISAGLTVLLGVVAIFLPNWFGTMAVVVLAAVMVASGIVSLLFISTVRSNGIPLTVLGPWVQIVAGVTLFIWPGIALWLVAVVLGGGLILTGIMGLYTLRNASVINPPLIKKIEYWSSIVLGVLLVIMGAAGSAVLLGIILGLALIGIGSQQWRMASI
jgi:hypothetical protein